MRPIPVSLLIHSADLNNVHKDAYGKETDVLAARLERVRVEPSTLVVTNAGGQDVQCTATLLIDARTSWPQDVQVSVGQTVVWQGRRYRVAVANPCYDGRRFHHWEAELTDG